MHASNQSSGTEILWLLNNQERTFCASWTILIEIIISFKTSKIFRWNTDDIKDKVRGGDSSQEASSEVKIKIQRQLQAKM